MPQMNGKAVKQKLRIPIGDPLSTNENLPPVSTNLEEDNFRYGYRVSLTLNQQASAKFISCALRGPGRHLNPLLKVPERV